MRSPIMTESEYLVLKLIGNGLTSQQIAELLYISIDTAEKCSKKLLEKFAAKNTAELVKKASQAHVL